MFFLAHKGKQVGPLSREDLQVRIREGKVRADDLAWKEGAPEWVPLRELLGSEEGFSWPPPLPQPRWHWSGWVSVFCGIAGLPCWFVLLVVAGLAHNQGHDERSSFMVAVGFALFVGLGLNLAAALVGGYGLTLPQAKKWPSIMGMVMNLFQLVGMAGITIFGMVTKGS